AAVGRQAAGPDRQRLGSEIAELAQPAARRRIAGHRLVGPRERRSRADEEVGHRGLVELEEADHRVEIREGGGHGAEDRTEPVERSLQGREAVARGQLELLEVAEEAAQMRRELTDGAERRREVASDRDQLAHERRRVDLEAIEALEREPGLALERG